VRPMLNPASQITNLSYNNTTIKFGKKLELTTD